MKPGIKVLEVRIKDKKKELKRTPLSSTDRKKLQAEVISMQKAINIGYDSLLDYEKVSMKIMGDKKG